MTWPFPSIDVTDRIHSASKRIAIYKPHAISDSGKELAVLIQQGASIICKAMDELETFSKNPSRLKDTVRSSMR